MSNPPSTLLNSIRGFSAASLTPTTTVEKGIVVTSDDSHKPGLGHDSDTEIREFFDTESQARTQVKILAELLRNSKHTVVYTGAGISTAAKIPDYRGPKGVWTLRDRGMARTGGLSIAQAVPTFAHMALALLYQKGMVKYVVSTNIDGLHRRSGLPVEGLAELHGNCYKEICKECKHEYLRDFDCTSQGCKPDHTTGRKCDHCPGKLLDSIIHFGEGLPDSELGPATVNAKKADLAIVLGTSMKVAPACHLPAMCFPNKGKLAICNLQKTTFDKMATVLMHVPTDIVLQMVLEELNLASEIPEVTPEGFPILRPSPYNPDELRQKSDQQLTQLKAATPATKIAVNLPLKARPTNEIVGKKGETSVIASQKGQPLLIRNCANCNFTVQDPSMKIIIEGLQSTTVTLSGMVLTGTCEVISCKDSSVVFNTQVPTITVDKCTNTAIAFSAQQNVAQFIWSNCSGLTVRSGTTDTAIPEAASLKPDVDHSISQFKTKVANGSISHALIIREGAGYATTEEEKRVHDEKERRNEALFMQALASFTISSSDRKQ